MDEINTRVLEKIGLTSGEIRVYIALLKNGQSSVGIIVNESGVSASKVYTILEKLKKHGLVSYIDKNGVKYFQTVEPKKIKDYLKQRKEELEKLEEEFEKILPKLEAIDKSVHVQTVFVYQGSKGMRVAHEHSYLKLKKHDEYYILGVPQYPVWAEVKGKFARYWEKDHDRRAAEGIKCKMLFNTDADKALLKKRNSTALCEARYMPIDIRTPAYLTIYKDTVLITTVSADPFCVEVVSQEIATAFKKYFDKFWQLSKQFKG